MSFYALCTCRLHWHIVTRHDILSIPCNNHKCRCPVTFQSLKYERQVVFPPDNSLLPDLDVQNDEMLNKPCHWQSVLKCPRGHPANRNGTMLKGNLYTTHSTNNFFKHFYIFKAFIKFMYSIAKIIHIRKI